MGEWTGALSTEFSPVSPCLLHPPEVGDVSSVPELGVLTPCLFQVSCVILGVKPSPLLCSLFLSWSPGLGPSKVLHSFQKVKDLHRDVPVSWSE